MINRERIEGAGDHGREKEGRLAVIDRRDAVDQAERDRDERQHHHHFGLFKSCLLVERASERRRQRCRRGRRRGVQRGRDEAVTDAGRRSVSVQGEDQQRVLADQRTPRQAGEEAQGVGALQNQDEKESAQVEDHVEEDQVVTQVSDQGRQDQGQRQNQA